jgi:hypothetical protein
MVQGFGLECSGDGVADAVGTAACAAAKLQRRECSCNFRDHDQEAQASEPVRNLTNGDGPHAATMLVESEVPTVHQLWNVPTHESAEQSADGIERLTTAVCGRLDMLVGPSAGSTCKAVRQCRGQECQNLWRHRCDRARCTGYTGRLGGRVKRRQRCKASAFKSETLIESRAAAARPTLPWPSFLLMC